jgi:hypothetical protein
MRRADLGTWRGRIVAACFMALWVFAATAVLDVLVWRSGSWREAASDDWGTGLTAGIMWFVFWTFWPDAFKPGRQRGE